MSKFTSLRFGSRVMLENMSLPAGMRFFRGPQLRELVGPSVEMGASPLRLFELAGGGHLRRVTPR